MLVLTRKSQEKIHIGDHVTITVVRIKGNTVRVGIEAPHDVRVIRGEIAPIEPTPDDGTTRDEPDGLLCTAEAASGEDVDPVTPGRSVTGRTSARPSIRNSRVAEITLPSAV